MRKKVAKPYTITYPNAIRVIKDSRVQVLREETKPEWLGWLWCKSEDGQEGWISKDYLNLTGDGFATLNRDYDAREVSVGALEEVQVLKEEKGWVWVRKRDGSEGWIPAENLETTR